MEYRHGPPADLWVIPPAFDKEFIATLDHLVETAKGTPSEAPVAKLIDLLTHPPMIVTPIPPSDFPPYVTR